MELLPYVSGSELFKGFSIHTDCSMYGIGLPPLYVDLCIDMCGTHEHGEGSYIFEH